MTSEKKPRRRPWRRQKYLQVPIGVNFKQQHLQRAMLNAFRRVRVKVKVKVAKMKMEMKHLKTFHEKEIAELREMETNFTQLRAETMHALEESVWTQVCLDTVEAILFAGASRD